MRIPVLISSARIQDKIKQLARRISHDYRKRPPLMICVLNGAFVFMADLIRQLTIPAKQHPVGAESSGIECDFIRLSSYGKTTKSSGKIKVVMDIECPVRGKNIIIVEDIIDTGLTAGFLVNRLKQAKARSIRICALLDKPARRMEPIKIDYPGFTVPNKFVVGYGLDYKEQYRQLPYIGYIPD